MPTSTPKMRLLPAFLQRGESLVAPAGAAACALILAVIAAAGWWTLHSNQIARREGRDQTVRAAAQFLAPAAEQLIATGELSQLRTLIAGAAGTHGFQSIRISLPDAKSTPIAESSPTDSGKYAPIPEPWPAGHVPDDTVFSYSAAGCASVAMPLNIAGKGAALLEIEDARPVTMWSDWRTQTGVGVIAAAALIALVGFYRVARSRFRALGAIRESLGAMRAGETDPGVLCIAKAYGPEAEAWNSVLTERRDMIDRLSRSTAEQKLGDRRGRDGDLFSLCDAMWQGLLLVDDKLRIKFVNGAGAVFLRGKREDMVGRDASGFIPDPKVLEALRATATGSGRGRAVLEVEGDKDPANPRAKAGSVFRYSIRPVRKEDNAAAVIVIEDITQQRVAEEARHTFVATATHELRTPLTNMRLYIDSLLEEPDQDVAKRTVAVNVVSQEAKRLERMVGDMLSVAQIESGTIKLNKGDVRLEPIFEDLKNDFAEQARQKEIKLRFDLPPKWPQLDGDRDKIVMALHNLVGNAIKYTPAGGEVIVRANTGSDNKSFTCEVVDNGIGIKEDEQPLVFEKFYRAKDRRIANITGTGLGLSIAREVVRLHGGDIALKSQMDKGSTFTMTLPAKAA